MFHAVPGRHTVVRQVPMPIIRTLICWLCWLVFTPIGASPAPQPLHYDIVFNNSTIGRLAVTAIASTNGIRYHADGLVMIHLLGEKSMKTLINSTYQDNLLTESSFLDQVNGKTKHDARVIREGTGYRIQVNEELSRLPNRRISYSAASLYYQEPVGISEVFSERHGQFCKVRPVGNHTYELTQPDGRKNRYRYARGACQEVEVNQRFFKFYFRLRNG